ncbi:AraC family transcriptional regulator [Thalassotalea euphylliae]|uniref:AraC family transcriptional regulator n=1 Tax=Thalassotalea euphylliae TaxID=1655234 RepID=A0A3E0U2M4_9GAMM|nr:AraC family transcriptional regulator [Thalassotalea euphylliae]REL30847.1 AraC family transcriptional regulator [Thalassotalea euphylliae]
MPSDNTSQLSASSNLGIALSIRSYTRKLSQHHHNHHQLVLPLHGNIELDIANDKQTIGPKCCAIIYQGELHSFAADECARFLVADLTDLPSKYLPQHQHYVSISDAFYAFIQYVEKQLAQPEFDDVSSALTPLFWSLLATQTSTHTIDKRLAPVLDTMAQQLANPLTLSDLAEQAHLSLSQFKAVFHQQLGTSPQQYLTNLRMEKAKALLSYTDLPIGLVAEQVGYQNASAFSRRFKEVYGQSPKAFSKH